MTPEAQRIAIAEACGWTSIVGPKDNLYGFNPDGFTRKLPNYLSDLNAMHEAEKVLNGSQIDLFKNYLNVLYTEPARIPHSATAAQRAEAFLRTLNLWTS